jgi:hypothetical protein
MVGMVRSLVQNKGIKMCHLVDFCASMALSQWLRLLASRPNGSNQVNESNKLVLLITIVLASMDCTRSWEHNT